MWEHSFIFYPIISENILIRDSKFINVPYISIKDDKCYEFLLNFALKYRDKNYKIIKVLIKVKLFSQKKWDVSINKSGINHKWTKFKVLKKREKF